MKDIIITTGQIKRELIALLVCFIVGFLANAGAIIYYRTGFTELVTSLPYVLAFALVIYVLQGVIRLILFVLGKVYRSKVHSK